MVIGLNISRGLQMFRRLAHFQVKISLTQCDVYLYDVYYFKSYIVENVSCVSYTLLTLVNYVCL